jgi:hypothetical protein
VVESNRSARHVDFRRSSGRTTRDMMSHSFTSLRDAKGVARAGVPCMPRNQQLYHRLRRQFGRVEIMNRARRRVSVHRAMCIVDGNPPKSAIRASITASTAPSAATNAVVSGSTTSMVSRTPFRPTDDVPGDLLQRGLFVRSRQRCAVAGMVTQVRERTTARCDSAVRICFASAPRRNAE